MVLKYYVRRCEAGTETGSMPECSPWYETRRGQCLLYEDLDALTVGNVAYVQKVAYLPTV